MSLLRRHASERTGELLRSFRLVAVGGARQSGKTTLVRELLGLTDTATVSFDDPATLARAIEDPVGFLAALSRPAAIDEFQRAGKPFLLAVKMAADRDRTRGQLLLTGSASYLADASIAETLAGRVGRLTLWPLSAGERRGTRETFVERLFVPSFGQQSTVAAIERERLIEEILVGGFPEVVTEFTEPAARRDWFDGYVADVVSREALRPLVDVRLESELRQTLRLLAARNGQELVLSALAADAGLARATTADYVTLLEALHLIVRIPAWATSATTRAKRHAKVFVVDSGLAAHLIDASSTSFAATADGREAGALFECFVTTEICKQIAWSSLGLTLSHFRDRNGAEVDLIVENRRGEITGLEVKLTATPLSRHVRHLAMLRDRLGPRFRVGVLLHAGNQTLSLGERLWALPVSALWQAD